MFNKILIANRGEIACRVMRTAKNMGVRTVAVYSDADTDALHVQMADEAVHIGGAAPADSYLVMDYVIAAARKTGAEAIHPGYGFLSENAEFSALCAQHKIVFIGPPADAIKTMGSKSAAKTVMEQAGVPLLPGYHGADQDAELLRSEADRIGYPVLLKAVSGGGGKGMRQVHEASAFTESLAAAKREAASSFGDDDMLIEKYLQQPRHVEVQVFCDTNRRGVYLFERDCSVQRRHQKIIEEAPAPGLTEQLRTEMGEAALRAAEAVNYVGAGTVEFLLDASGHFYFMEMNTRLQVEHPVTEMITGQDLVEWQLRVAHGEPVPCSQAELEISGHAFEARIYAEDPDNEFLPAAGTVEWLQQPAESRLVRVDTGVVAGDEVGVFYDPMIAKLIVWERDRETALRLLRTALAAYRIVGVTTNIEFLRKLAASDAFSSADLSTDLIERNRAALFAPSSTPAEAVPLAVLFGILTEQNTADVAGSPWAQNDRWRVNMTSRWQETLVNGEEEISVSVEQTRPGAYRMHTGDHTREVRGRLTNDVLEASIDGHSLRIQVVESQGIINLFMADSLVQLERKQPDLGEDVHQGDGAGFRAPMNGTVVDILVSTGQQVRAGETLVIMEAMKMEHPVKAPVDGSVTELFFAKGDLVDGGADLLAFEPAVAES